MNTVSEKIIISADGSEFRVFIYNNCSGKYCIFICKGFEIQEGLSCYISGRYQSDKLNINNKKRLTRIDGFNTVNTASKYTIK